MTASPGLREYLEADGLGGFACGTVSGIRTRRYHALLSSAHPPAGRAVLVNGFDARVRTNHGNFSISSQRYAPGVIDPDGAAHLKAFKAEPWPQWTFELPDGTTLVQELFVVHGSPLTVVSWALVGRQPRVKLEVRPFISGRDCHALHHENSAARLEASAGGECIVWQPYPEVAAVYAASNGAYFHQPDWYRRFLYTEEQSRGLEACEDLIAPGVFRWELSTGEAFLCFTTAGGVFSQATLVARRVQQWRKVERRRRAAFATPLHRAAGAYIVKRGQANAVVAGYPWFPGLARDTFVALRGLCLAAGRLEEARKILLAWAAAVSEGMLPDRLPENGKPPEFSSVDASLWYVISAGAFLKTLEAEGKRLPKRDQAVFRKAIDSILDGYAKGSRFGIRLDEDGLLAAGAPGASLTWMNAKAGSRAVSPRIGKPVEVEALWINALWIGSAFSGRWEELFAKAREAFRAKFWNPQANYLYDVIDAGHVPGRTESACRPNQIFAVGGLPLKLMDGERGRKIVAAVQQKLLTPMGLRSLAPGEPGYAPRYEGGVSERDGAYHQGTVWPWLMGPFVEAWIRIHGSTPENIQEARKRFIEPLKRQLQAGGIGHLPEIADAELPHTPRGCPFQACSLAELLRLEVAVLSAQEELPTPVQAQAAPLKRAEAVHAG